MLIFLCVFLHCCFQTEANGNVDVRHQDQTVAVDMDADTTIGDVIKKYDALTGRSLFGHSSISWNAERRDPRELLSDAGIGPESLLEIRLDVIVLEFRKYSYNQRYTRPAGQPMIERVNGEEPNHVTVPLNENIERFLVEARLPFSDNSLRYNQASEWRLFGDHGQTMSASEICIWPRLCRNE